MTFFMVEVVVPRTCDGIVFGQQSTLLIQRTLHSYDLFAVIVKIVAYIAKTVKVAS